MRHPTNPPTRGQWLRMWLSDAVKGAARVWQSAAFAVFLGLAGAMVLAHAKACEEVESFCVVQAVSK
jgi:hypothetical protein